MRASLLVFLVGCGFTAPAGENQPADARKPIDSTVSGDGPQLDAPADMQIDAPVGAMCPASYTPILALAASTSRYRFVATPAEWLDAEHDCEDDAAVGELPTHLVVLDDAGEKTAIIGGIAGNLGINDQYIGATDLAEEGEVSYVTSQSTTLALSPSMGADNKDCIRIKSNGNEEFRACNEVNKFVCECDGSNPNPNRFPNPPDGNGNN
jgi:lectin-like protein